MINIFFKLILGAGMLEISDEQFEKLISQAMDELPQDYIERLDNIAVVYEDDPSEEQRQRLRLHRGQSLYGLYEGIPKTKRGTGYNLVLPDKITIFKNPILGSVRNMDELKKQIKHTLWHEIAHHYGLDHGRINELENK